MSDRLAMVNSYIKEQKMSEAKLYCQQWIENEPQDPMAHQSMGLLEAQAGNFKKALPYFLEALGLAPRQPSFHTNIANTYKALADAKNAKIHYQYAIDLQPNSTTGYNNMGALLYQQAEYLEAISFFEKSLRLNPNLWETHYNLANSLVQLDMTERAIVHYLQAKQLNPDFPNINQNLAMAYLVEKEYNLALPLLEESARINNSHPEINTQLAELYLEMGKIDKAVKQFQTAIDLNPTNPILYHNLGVLHLRLEDRKRAKELFEKSLKLDENNPTAKHLLKAFNKENTPDQAPTKYISDLFDQYAQFYDSHVQETLEYNVPEQLRTYFRKTYPNNVRSHKILDLGCGTGLCGVYFSDAAHHFVGVDLSIHMLARAKRVTAYDSLCQLDILQAIPGEDMQYFSLILAADVFVYLGELESILQKCHSALAPKGIIGFTVEQNNDNDSYSLLETGRFAHSGNYIEKTAEKIGFSVDCQEPVTLRKASTHTITGDIYYLSKKN